MSLKIYYAFWKNPNWKKWCRKLGRNQINGWKHFFRKYQSFLNISRDVYENNRLFLRNHSWKSGLGGGVWIKSLMLNKFLKNLSSYKSYKKWEKWCRSQMSDFKNFIKHYENSKDIYVDINEYGWIIGRNHSWKKWCRKCCCHQMNEFKHFLKS